MSSKLQQKFLSNLFSEHKHFRLFILIFFPFLLLFLAALFLYNLHNQQLVKAQISERFDDIYNVTQRFGSHYDNTDSLYLNKGIHYINHVGVMVNKSGEVKVLSTGLNKLSKRLNDLAPHYVWTVAALEKTSPANNYAHFKPLRPEYIKLNENEKDQSSWIDDIVKKEDLVDTYKDFYSCNLKISEPYVENGSNEKIRSIYYPVYTNRALASLLVVDLKVGIISQIISDFNDEYFTFLQRESNLSGLSISFLLPCSSEGVVIIGINYKYLVATSGILSLFMSFIVSVFVQLIKFRRMRLHRDHMTNFFRRDYFEAKLQTMKVFSILIIDIDHFKQVNDNYGHKMGDEVIKTVCRRLRAQIRNDDVAIRWGGEEFLISFSYMTKAQLFDKAEQLRMAVEQEAINSLTITVSIGGTCSHELSFVDVFNVADKALYSSKQQGRNQTTIA